MSFWTKLAKGVGSAVSSFVPVVGPFVGDLISGVADEQESKDARKAQMADSRSMMNYQNELNIQNWHMHNEYNTPKAQLGRYMDAGINPLAVGVDGGQASTPASVSGQPAPDIGSLLNYQIEAAKARADLGLIHEQTKAQKIENRAASAEADVRQAEAEAKSKAYKKRGSSPGDDWQYNPEDNTYSRVQGNTVEVMLAGTKLDEIISARLDREVSESRAVSASARLQEIETELRAKYGDQLQAGQLKQILSNVLKLDLENRLNKIDVEFFENLGVGGRMASGITSIILKSLKALKALK